MPRINLNQPVAAAPPVDNDPLTLLAQRLRKGEVVPIIGNMLTYNLVLGGYEKLVALYVQNYLPGHALSPDLDLARLTQYYHIMGEDGPKLDVKAQREKFLDFLKNLYFSRIDTTTLPQAFLETVDAEFDDLSLSKLLERLGYAMIPTEMANPWRILAEFPLPVYLTTCCHDLLQVALREAGKSPRTQICRWTDLRVESVFDGHYVPSKAEPLVYHLHGRDDYPESLVLTENDYLEFLTKVTRNQGDNSTDFIPSKVREVLNASSLMLLGYDLRQWEFISLFWGLIKPRTRNYNSIVSLQLELREFEQKYVQEYLRLYQFEVYQGQAVDHLGQLYERFQR